GVLRRRHRARSRRVGGAIGDPDGARHRPHDAPVPLCRAPGALRMMPDRQTPRGGKLRYLPHMVLCTGMLVVAFPIYVTLVASTLTSSEILSGPMPLLPGPHLVENYRGALLY